VLTPFCQRTTLREWIRNGVKTENIEFRTAAGASYIYQVKDTLSSEFRGFRLPKKDGVPVDVETHLRNHGVPAELITRLVQEKEFVDKDVMVIPMAKLEKEKPALAERLITLILAASASEGGVKTKNGKGETIKFTDDELAELVESAHDVTIQKDFLDRIVGHVRAVVKDNEEDAVEALEKVMAAIPPQWAYGSVKPGLNAESVIRELVTESDDDENEKAKKPEPKTEEFDTPKYTLRATGLEVEVIRKKDNKSMGKKTCDDAGHLRNTIKKWQNDANNLDAFVAENA
jgi:hypothetical protein